MSSKSQKRTHEYSVQVDSLGILRIVEQAKPTVESSVAMAQDVRAAVQEHGVSRVLIDLSLAGIPPSLARKNIASMLKTSGLEKAAIFGTSTAIRVVAGFITRAAGMKNVKIFQTEEQALTWLKESN